MHKQLTVVGVGVGMVLSSVPHSLSPARKIHQRKMDKKKMTLVSLQPL